MAINLSPAEWVQLHARLLASREMRSLLRHDRVELARRLHLRASETDAIASLDPDGIDRQARGLVDKRWQETAKLMPRTVRRLGSEGKSIFEIYADTYWPEGHRRHLLDASAFLDYMRRCGNLPADAEECARIHFFAGSARLAIRFHKRLGHGSQSGPGVQFLWRRGRVFERFLYLAFPFCAKTAFSLSRPSHRDTVAP
jgi:hypothetical protein